MLSVNPFAAAGASLPAGFLQWFLVVMFLAVVVGTLFDIIHKGSARYFFANMARSKGKGREVGGGGEGNETDPRGCEGGEAGSAGSGHGFSFLRHSVW